MTDTTSIPLNKLVVWEGNARQTAGTKEGIAELAASIKAHGLINPLAVRARKDGKHDVGAGGRRLASLQLLAKNGDIPADHPIACKAHDGIDDNAFLELSLAENRAREDMHPADEFEAFRKLADDGLSTSEIGARFGVTEKYVVQRLKLARVSPVIVKAYREGDIELDAVEAFAVSDDHKRQERFWKSAPKWQREREDMIREALTEGLIPATDRRVRLVTLAVYEKAGGTVQRDLFTDGDDGVFITKTDLLTALLAEKVDGKIQALVKQGWKWAEFLPEGDFPTGKVTSIQPASSGKYSKAQMANAGVFLKIGYDARLEIDAGYVKREDAKAAKAADPKSKNGDKAKVADKAGLSQSLTEDLVGERTAAVAALLAGDPKLALRAVVHGIALEAIYPHAFVDTPLGISIDDTFYPVGFEERCKPKAVTEHENRRKAWEKKLPGKAKLWQWCLDADQNEMLSLLAFCAACSVQEDEMLASHLGVDMTKWFTPTVANYFGRVGKPELIAAMKEAGKPASTAIANMKKGALAIQAEQAVKGTHWLPKLLRTATAKVDKKPLKKAA